MSEITHTDLPPQPGTPAADSLQIVRKRLMPGRVAMSVVDLGTALRPRPKKAQTKRIGIVPQSTRSPMVDVATPENADGFTFPANGGATDTNVSNHGGATAPSVPVQLIFWGTSWTTTDAGLREQLVSAAMNLIEGPYPSAVGQYGLAGPSLRGTTTVISPAAPASFDDGTIGDLVWSCIDAGF